MTERMLGELICEYTLQSTGATASQTARAFEHARPERSAEFVRAREGHGRVIAPALGHDFQWIRDVDPGIDVVDGNALAAGVTLQPDCADRLGGLDAHGLSRR
jgi:hypothetical protein